MADGIVWAGHGARAAAAAAGRRARVAAFAPRELPHVRSGALAFDPRRAAPDGHVRRAARLRRHGRLRREAAPSRRSPPRCRGSPRDGRTYTFRIRDGFRFSPPSNEPVTAATFKHTLERAFSPKLGRGGRGPSEAPAIAGPRPVPRRQGPARLRDQGERRHAVDHARAAVGRLPRPDLAAASLPGSAERAGPPDRARPPAAVVGALLRVVGGDGRVVLLPNPGYGGKRSQRWARIVYTLDVPTAVAVALADRGALDYLPFDFDIASLLGRWGALDRRYGPASAAAEQGGSATSPRRAAFVDYIVLNANRPLFRDVRLRRAVNYALDRPGARGGLPRQRRATDRRRRGRRLPGRRRLSARRARPRDAPAGSRATGTGSAVLDLLHVLPLRRRRPALRRADREGEPRADRDRRRDRPRTDQCPPSHDAALEPRRPLARHELRLAGPRPAALLDRALGRGRYALGPRAWAVVQPVVPERRFEAARALRGDGADARVRAPRAGADAGARRSPSTARSRSGSTSAPRIGCQVTTGAYDLLDLASARAAPASGSSVQVNRVRLSRGASPPGRGPRWTSSTGGRASRTSARRAAPMPSWRQRGEIADHDEARAGDRVDELVRVCEHGRRVDVDDALDGERRVGEQAAGVAAAARGVGPRADEPQRRAASQRRARRRARARPSRARRRRTARRRRRRATRTRAREHGDVAGERSSSCASGAGSRGASSPAARRRARGRPRSRSRAASGRAAGSSLVNAAVRAARPVRADRGGRGGRELVLSPRRAARRRARPGTSARQPDERADADRRARARRARAPARAGAGAAAELERGVVASGSPARAPAAAPTARSRSSRRASCRVAR